MRSCCSDPFYLIKSKVTYGSTHRRTPTLRQMPDFILSSYRLAPKEGKALKVWESFMSPHSDQVLFLLLLLITTIQLQRGL